MTRALPSRHFSRAAVAWCLLVACLALACQPTPSYIRRWANTEGSEEKFVGYLQDSSLPLEVRVTALELLLDQWSYSSAMLSEGAAVKQIEDTAVRDQILRGVVPHMRTRFAEGDKLTVEMRDAAYHLRSATTTPEVIAEFDAILSEWLLTKWDPCRVGSGLIRTLDVVSVLGEATAGPKVAEVIRQGAFDRVLCFGRDVVGVEWMKTSDLVAQAYIDRWASGNIDEHAQLQFELLEQTLRLSAAPLMRAWVFQRIADPNTDPLHKNAMLDAVANAPSAADAAGYRSMLTSETNTRWAAFQALVDSGGSEGLQDALQNLPATGEYGYYNSAIAPDGLKQVTANFLCSLTKLRELGDNARVVFERHMTSDNIYARLISIACLATYGDAQTYQRLTDYKGTLGRTPVPAPAFGEGATVQGVIDETLTAIATRVNAARQ